jgi:hypothetical protein
MHISIGSENQFKRPECGQQPLHFSLAICGPVIYERRLLGIEFEQVDFRFGLESRLGGVAVTRGTTFIWLIQLTASLWMRVFEGATHQLPSRVVTSYSVILPAAKWSEMVIALPKT